MCKQCASRRRPPFPLSLVVTLSLPLSLSARTRQSVGGGCAKQPLPPLLPLSIPPSSPLPLSLPPGPGPTPTLPLTVFLSPPLTSSLPSSHSLRPLSHSLSCTRAHARSPPLPLHLCVCVCVSYVRQYSGGAQKAVRRRGRAGGGAQEGARRRWCAGGGVQMVHRGWAGVRTVRGRAGHRNHVAAMV